MGSTQTSGLRTKTSSKAIPTGTANIQTHEKPSDSINSGNGG